MIPDVVHEGDGVRYDLLFGCFGLAFVAKQLAKRFALDMDAVAKRRRV